MSIHVLSQGLTPCGLDINFRWPDEAQWVPLWEPASGSRLLPSEKLKNVDCWRCITTATWKLVPREPPSPNHEKHKASGELTQKLCEFVKEFLPQKGIILAEMHSHDEGCGKPRVCDMRENELFFTSQDIVKLSAEFVGIDFAAFHAEKDALLRHVRQMNALREWALGEGKKLLLEGRHVKLRCRHCSEAVEQLDWHGNFAHVAEDPSCSRVKLTQENDDVYEELPRCNKPVKGFLCDEEPGHGGKCHSRLYRKKV